MTAEYFDEKQLFWVCPEGKDNHFWDCEVMALVAAYELDVRNWRRAKIKPKEVGVKGKRIAVVSTVQKGIGNRPSWYNQRR